jgi:hypothetical protein
MFYIRKVNGEHKYYKYQKHKHGEKWTSKIEEARPFNSFGHIRATLKELKYVKCDIINLGEPIYYVGDKVVVKNTGEVLTITGYSLVKNSSPIYEFKQEDKTEYYHECDIALLTKYKTGVKTYAHYRIDLK